MARLPILVAPDPRLKKKALPVETVNDEVRTLLDDMLETMYSADGIGLAAPQVGIGKRVVVIDTAAKSDKRNPLRLVNPEILDVSEDNSEHDEGCLSLPDMYAPVVRPTAVTIKYLDHDGKEQALEADELLATCIQHEIDHLDGILFVDHVSALKRNMILRKLTKLKKTGQLATV